MSWDLDSVKTWGKSFLHRGESKQEGAEAGSSKACGRTGRRLERLHIRREGTQAGEEARPGGEGDGAQAIGASGHGEHLMVL